MAHPALRKEHLTTSLHTLSSIAVSAALSMLRSRANVTAVGTHEPGYVTVIPLVRCCERLS